MLRLHRDSGGKMSDRQRKKKAATRVGACLLTAASLSSAHAVDTTSTRTAQTLATTGFYLSGDCLNTSFNLTIEKDRVRPAGSATATVQAFTRVDFYESDWCAGTSRSFASEWPGIAGSTIDKSLQSASLSFSRNVNLEECTTADGVPNCTTRSVPLVINTAWTANGDYTLTNFVQRGNLTGQLVRFKDVGKVYNANVGLGVVLAGEVQEFSPAYGTLASEVTKETVTP
jgi:hypothetical protein